MSEHASIQTADRESPRGLSMLSTFAECPRKWYLKYIVGLESEYGKSSLILGSNIHKAKETFYKTRDGSRLVQTFEALMKISKPDYEDPTQYQKDLEDGRTMLAYWLDKLGMNDLEKYEIYMIETEIQTELIPNFHVTDRLDLVLKENNDLAVIDTKTTRYSIDKSFESVAAKDQATSYIGALRTQIADSGLRVVGLYPDVMYKRGKVVDARRPALITRTEEDYHRLKMKKIRLFDLLTEAYNGIYGNKQIDYYFPAYQNSCANWGCSYMNICRQVVLPGDMPEGFVRDPWIEEGIIKETIQEWMKARKIKH